MPAQYERIRDSYIKAGKPAKEAKRLAAMTWNEEHPDDPNPWNREGKSHRMFKAKARRK